MSNQNQMETYDDFIELTPNPRLSLQSITQRNYSAGIITIDQAISAVSDTDGFGDFYAGQWQIEKASELQDPLAIKQTLEQANESFKRSAAKELERTSGRINGTLTLARILNAHIPIYASIFAKSLLPNEQLARTAYEKTIKIGYELSRQVSSISEIDLNEKRKINICLSKIAVEALLERHTIKENMTDYWFPMIATISARTGNRVSTDGNEILDIQILQNKALYGYEAETDNPICVVSRIHVNPRSVKSIDEAGPYLSPNSSIKRVDVSPDLKLDGTLHTNIPADIIEDCMLEKFHNSGSIRALATSRLDTRTDLLLSTLNK
ncbi:MAG TPA: hypothetical protein VII94_05715 [Candidatus Saccharimonadales bacterium]